MGVELAAERGLTHKIYDVTEDPGPSDRQLVVSQAPMHRVESDGAFTDIDTYLVPATGEGVTHRSTTSSLDVDISKLQTPVIIKKPGKAAITLKPSDRPEPISGLKNMNKVLYQDAYTNTDIDRYVTPIGFKQNITLKAAGHPTSFSTQVTTGNMTLEAQPDGSVHVLDGAEVVYYIEAPFLEDMRAPFSHANEDVAPYLRTKIPLVWDVVGNTITVDISGVDFESLTYPMTIDPSVSPYSGTNDGRMRRFNASWTTVRNSGTSSDVNTTNTAADTVGSFKAGANRYCYRMAMFFATSAIPDGDTIDDATLSMYLVKNGTGEDIYAVPFTGPTTLVSSSYNQTNFGGATPTSGGLIAKGDITTNSRNDISLITSVITIDKTGTTQIGLRDGLDFVNTDPTGSSNYINTYQSDASGTSKDPQLTVNYSTPSAGGVRGFRHQPRGIRRSMNQMT